MIAGAQARLMPGVVVGVVTTTTGDPQNLGRIRVRFPWFETTILSNWCRVASFFAGSGVGAYFLPAVGAEVLVAFEGGDVNSPYVIGSLWNGKDLPPVSGEAQQQNVRTIQTSGGTVIRIDDTKDKEQISITDKAGDKLVFDVTQKSVTLTSVGDLTITADQALKLSGATIELNSKGTINVSGKGVSVQGGPEVSMSAGFIKLNC